MRLKLHNIGPIRDADISLARLTVFVGPNGSGKTILSSVAYAVTRALQRAIEDARFSYLQRERQAGRGSQDIDVLLARVVSRWEEVFRDQLEAELRRCCARDLNMLGREGRGGGYAAPRILVSDGPSDAPNWSLVFRLQSDGLILEKKNPSFSSPVLRASDLEKDGRRLLPREVAARFRRTIPQRAFYFPASRSGFMQTYGALTSLVWAALGAGHFQDATVGAIPGTAADFLQFLAQVKPVERWEPGADAAAVLEESVLHGSISLQQGEGSPQVFFKPDGSDQSWPIEETATATAELAPLVLYLRYEAARSHAIFIDEPEAHLHPENQIALASALANTAGMLKHVVIATHSEFLVSELSNITMESQLSLLSEETHRAPSIRVYEFEGEALDGGVNACLLRADPREGFQIDQFATVADKTYNRAVDLYNLIQRQEESRNGE